MLEQPRFASVAVGTVGVRPMSPPASDLPATLAADTDNSTWLDALKGDGAARDQAVESLHELLLGAARHEVSRRRASLHYVRGEELEDIATQAADDALMAVLGKLDDFRGASRFTTWAYKFALLEAGVRLRKRAWQDREVVLDTESWSRLGEAGPGPEADAEHGELLSALAGSIGDELTPHQRQVLVALTLDDVPIDVLAERLDTTRGALYKTLHDARRKLRAAMTDKGFSIDGI